MLTGIKLPHRTGKAIEPYGLRAMDLKKFEGRIDQDFNLRTVYPYSMPKTCHAT